MMRVGKVIKYFGGKSGSLANQIRAFFPSEYDVYVEPFGGSAALMLKQKADVEIYNDLYNNVYCLFKTLSDKSLFNEFKAKCDLAYYHEKLRSEFRQLLKTDLSVLDRAFYFYYVNRTSHNGIGGFSVNKNVRRNMSKSTSDYLTAIDNLDFFHKRLSTVIITNKDAFEVIKKHDSKETFLYLDPPYHWDTRTEARYPVDMSPQKHIDLVELCLKCESKILISGYDHKVYDKLLKNGWNKKHLLINSNSGKDGSHKTKVETIWMNYIYQPELF